MRSQTKLAAALSAFVALAGCVEDDSSSAGRPAVGSESDLRAFEGARAGQAEMGIRNLGYVPARTQGLTTFWYNASTGACAQIITSDGRYSSVRMVSSQYCGR